MGDFFRHLVVRFGLTIVILAVIGGGMGIYALYDYGFVHHVRICIDNTSRRSITVTFNDREIATVPAGRSELVTMRHGEYHIVATSGEETLFDETKTLTRPTSGDYNSFVFNPDGEGRYWITEITYGTQSPFLPPPSVTIESVVRNLTEEIPVVDPPNRWSQVTADYMLEERFPEEVKMPESVRSATRTGLRRLSPDDYDIIAAARKNGTKPNGDKYTPDEIQPLEDRVIRIFNAGEFAGQ